MAEWTPSPQPGRKSVILYDGVCGLCNRLNLFVLKRDKEDSFRFLSLQSDQARKLLERYGRDPADLDTVYVVSDYERPSQKLYDRASAILFILGRLGGIWSLMQVFGVLPRFVLNAAYAVVARNRYRIFGKYDACPLPDPNHRAKFLEGQGAVPKTPL